MEQKTIEQRRKEAIESFEFMRNSAELKALSNLSLEQPLTDEQYNKMMSLAKKLNMVGGKQINQKSDRINHNKKNKRIK